MVSTFSGVIQTSPVEEYTKAVEAKPKDSGCCYWLKWIFCCGCCRKQKVELPAARYLQPMSAPQQPLPALDLKYFKPAEVALDILGSVAEAPRAQASNSTTFSLEAPGEVSSGPTVHVQVSVSISSNATGSRAKTIYTGRSMFSPASASVEGRQAAPSVLGVFSLLKASAGDVKDEEKAPA
jgi:hypothetical protein